MLLLSDAFGRFFFQKNYARNVILTLALIFSLFLAFDDILSIIDLCTFAG